MFILIMKGNTQINRMEVLLLIILRFWAVRISFRYAIVYVSSVAFVRRVDHSSFILSCNLIGQRENKSHYVTEIVLPLGYADVIFRRRESRQPEIRLRSQATQRCETKEISHQKSKSFYWKIIYPSITQPFIVAFRFKKECMIPPKSSNNFPGVATMNIFRTPNVKDTEIFNTFFRVICQTTKVQKLMIGTKLRQSGFLGKATSLVISHLKCKILNEFLLK